jgi:hypothetical protein
MTNKKQTVADVNLTLSVIIFNLYESNITIM